MSPYRRPAPREPERPWWRRVEFDDWDRRAGIACIALGLMGLAVYLLACAIPDTSDLNLSGCMRLCNSDLDYCLAHARLKLDECGEDTKCARETAPLFEGCITAEVDCVTDCIEKAEAQL